MAIITGDNSNNILKGTSEDDSIDALDGNDLLYGNEGNDTLIGGNGNDRIIIGGGRAIANGGTDQDILFVNYNSSTSNITYSAFDPVNSSGTITNGAKNSVTYQSIEAFVISGGFGNDDLRGRLLLGVKKGKMRSHSYRISSF